MDVRTIWRSFDHWFTEPMESLDRREWHKKPLSVVALYLFLCVLLFWTIQTPPPGFAVAALAVAAAIMTIAGEMKGKEKLAWILLLFAFLGVELHAIREERNFQDEMQRASRYDQQIYTMRELKNFKDISTGIQTSIVDSDRNFNAQMGKTNQVLKNITGGDSFAYVAPQNFSGDQFPGLVWNNGEQALVGLTLTIAHTSDPVTVWGAAFYKPIFIGTVGPHDHAPIPEFLFQPRADEKTGQDNYWIMLSAQNGTAQQSLYFRRNRLHPQYWAYSFNVVRLHYAEKPQREKLLTKIDNTPRKGSTQELLLLRAWSDDMEAAASQKH